MPIQNSLQIVQMCSYIFIVLFLPSLYPLFGYFKKKTFFYLSFFQHMNQAIDAKAGLSFT